MTQADLFDPGPEYSEMSTVDLVDLAWNLEKSISRRFAAVSCLGGRAKKDSTIVPLLLHIATSIEMRNERIMHLVSLAHMAAMGLVYCGSEEALAAARSAFEGFDSDDREALASSLRSAGLTVPYPPENA